MQPEVPYTTIILALQKSRGISKKPIKLAEGIGTLHGTMPCPLNDLHESDTLRPKGSKMETTFVHQRGITLK
jgi:hypothetical protein